MRAACHAAGGLPSLFFFGGCTVTHLQYPESFGAKGVAKCSHRLARPLRPFEGVYGGPRVVGGVRRGVVDRPSSAVGVPRPFRAASPPAVPRGVPRPFRAASPGRSARRLPAVPRGREFRPIRTRWREISTEIAVFPPSASQTIVSRCHPEPHVRSHRPPQSPPALHAHPRPFRAGGSFGRSAPDGGRFPLRLQFSLLQRRRVKATGDSVRSTVLRSKATGSTVSPPKYSP